MTIYELPPDPRRELAVTLIMAEACIQMAMIRVLELLDEIHADAVAMCKEEQP